MIKPLIHPDIQFIINDYFTSNPQREYTKFDYLFVINETPFKNTLETEKTFDVKLENGKSYTLDLTKKVLYKNIYSVENWNKKTDNDIAEIIYNAINDISKKISDSFPHILFSKKWIPVFYNNYLLRTGTFLNEKEIQSCRIIDPIIGFPLDLAVSKLEKQIELIISVTYDFIKPE